MKKSKFNRFAPEALRSFILAGTFFAAATGAHAQKTWTGTTSNLWTDGENWSPGGAPTSGTVIFDGTGSNLSNNLNGTARSLSLLSFSTGQSSGVTITTANTAALALVATGTSTTLDVLAGLEQRCRGAYLQLTD